MLTLKGQEWDQQSQTMDYAIYNGPLYAVSPTGTFFPAYAHSSVKTLEELGTIAIRECSPSNPAADVSVAIGELFKDGIPKIIGSTFKSWLGMSNRQRRKAVGHEYLNVEFGWRPFIKDLREVCNSVINAQKIIDQYERDSGKLVRRTFGFPSTREVTSVRWDGVPSVWPIPHSLLQLRNFTGKGYLVRTYCVERKQWFSGGFTYYLPPLGQGLRSEIARTVIQSKKLLGLTLTPDTLWSLAPWSWLVDWFSNTSEVLENWANWAIDSQVLRYGYMMEHTVASYTYTFVGPTGLRSSEIRPFDVTLCSETKQRIKATPYGFGIDIDALTARQNAIITALGLSRGKK